MEDMSLTELYQLNYKVKWEILKRISPVLLIIFITIILINIVLFNKRRSK